MKHDTSFFVVCSFFFPIFECLCFFVVGVVIVRSKKFSYMAKHHDGKVLVSRTCIVIARSWKTCLLNGCLVHRDELQKNTSWKGEKRPKVTFSPTWHTRYSQYERLMESRDYSRFHLSFVVFFSPSILLIWFYLFVSELSWVCVRIESKMQLQNINVSWTKKKSERTISKIQVNYKLHCLAFSLDLIACWSTEKSAFDTNQCHSFHTAPTQ